MGSLIKDKDTGVMYRKWQVDESKDVLLLVHGLGAHSGRWEFLANYTTQYGFSSYGIELKGFGFNSGKKGHIDSLDIYSRDICSLRDIILKETPWANVYLLGESLGGLIAFLTVLKNRDKFKGVICLSPAFKSKLKFSFSEYLKIAAASLFNTGREFKMPFTKEMCTRDIGYQAVLDTHNAEHRIGTAGLLKEIAKAQISCLLHKKDINTDILFLLAGKDRLVDNNTTKKIFKRIKTGNKKLIEYPLMYHALSIEISRNEVFKDIVEWIKRTAD